MAWSGNSSWDWKIIDRRLKLALADGLMYADDKEIYSASDLKVGLFTE